MTRASGSSRTPGSRTGTSTASSRGRARPRVLYGVRSQAPRSVRRGLQRCVLWHRAVRHRCRPRAAPRPSGTDRADRLAGGRPGRGDRHAAHSPGTLREPGRSWLRGRGRRCPTSVPISCHVTYIDKFTFDEAADGSFVCSESENLVTYRSTNRSSTCPRSLTRLPISSSRATSSNMWRSHCGVEGARPDVEAAGKGDHGAFRRPIHLRRVTTPHDDRAHPCRPSLTRPRRARSLPRILPARGTGAELGRAGARGGGAEPRYPQACVYADTMSELLALVSDEIPFSSVDVLEPAHGSTVQEFFVLLDR